MKKLLILISMALLYTLPLSAQDQVWQKPVIEQCTLAPGEQCNVEAMCPASHPLVVAGGGGMPQALPENNQVAMTMNLPLSTNQWRVCWKNLSNTDTARIKVVLKVLCTTK